MICYIIIEKKSPNQNEKEKKSIYSIIYCQERNLLTSNLEQEFRGPTLCLFGYRISHRTIYERTKHTDVTCEISCCIMSTVQLSTLS